MIPDNTERKLEGLQFFCLSLYQIQPSDKSYAANNTLTCCRTIFPIEL